MKLFSLESLCVTALWMQAGFAHMKINPATLPIRTCRGTDTHSPAASSQPANWTWGPGTGSYPCQGCPPEPSDKTIEAGSTISIDYVGAPNGDPLAHHNGGYCLFGLSFDGGQTYFNFQHGECTIVDPDIVHIPKGLPTGEVTLIWTWYNTNGNREIYQNCADVSIDGPSHPQPIDGFEPLVANMPGAITIPEQGFKDFVHSLAADMKPITVFPKPGLVIPISSPSTPVNTNTQSIEITSVSNYSRSPNTNTLQQTHILPSDSNRPIVEGESCSTDNTLICSEDASGFFQCGSGTWAYVSCQSQQCVQTELLGAQCQTLGSQ